MAKNKIKKSKEEVVENDLKTDIGPKKKKKKKDDSAIQKTIQMLQSKKFRNVCGVFFVLFSLFLTVAFISHFFTWYADYNQLTERGVGSLLFNNDIKLENWGGRIGGFFGYLLIERMFGISSFLLIILLFVSGSHLLKLPLVKSLPKMWFRSFFWMIWAALFFGYINSFLTTEKFLNLAGFVGWYSSQWLIGFAGKAGTAFILLFLLIGFLLLEYNLKVKIDFKKLFSSFKKVEKKEKKKKSDLPETPTVEPVVVTNFSMPEDESEEYSDEEKAAMLDFEIHSNKPEPQPESNQVNFSIENETPKEKKEFDGSVDFEIDTNRNISNITEEETDTEKQKHYTVDEPYDPKLELKDFKFPSVDSLINYEEKNVEVTSDELVANKDKIVETLKSYSIDIVKIVASPGPTVTLYEIVPAPGIRISKIKNLEDDIALSLSALGIRIIAPIPGRGTIGIEVPNAKPQIVSMKTMLSSDKFVNSKMELPVALGKTISNEPFVADLAKMPHLLMAGATGQGKSVGLNAIISSLIYKKHPAELKFVMVDPKKVELSLYSKIERHYLAKMPDTDEPIITDTRKVVRTLNSLCIEMDARYDLLKDAQVRNIKEYNPKFIARKLNPENGHKFLPYIVLVVDEFADLIMTAGKEVETPIARLAQLARAVGIHLIIATQRPSVNIITGTIKANFPARIAFRVTSMIDSRTILDAKGAEQLIGRGDMLLSLGSELIRLQCALIDTEEIEGVADFIGNQRGYPDCFELPEYLDENAEPSKEFDPNQKDEKFEEAARLVVSHQHGSTSLLQRKLQLGYNRAGRIIDQLEAAGIVGPFEGSKAREVKIKTEYELEELLKNQLT